MKRFSQWSPLTYRLAVEKNILQRRLTDALSGLSFAETRQKEPLPHLIYAHNSLIRRTLGQVDPRLQDNKAVSLGLAAPCVDGVLIRPGETFSFWRLVGRCTAKRGFLPGMVLHDGVPREGVGGGMCQFTNLLHWMALHSDLTVTERHHHDQYDLFPDFGRQVPFGVGTSILYNYLDYRLRNDTPDTYQLLVHSDGRYLRGQLRCTAAPPHVWHLSCQEESFSREDGHWYRSNQVIRRKVDRQTGNTLETVLLQQAHARVMYDEAFIPPEKVRAPGRFCSRPPHL